MSANELLITYERLFGPFVHMGTADKAIWLRFLMQGGNQYAPFEYDVRVGDGLPVPAGEDEMYKRINYVLTTKRIDVVFEHSGTLWIVEVKQRAGLTAIGQVLGYRDLYQWTFPKAQNVGMWIVTDTLQPDMQLPLTMNNIRYTEVGY